MATKSIETILEWASQGNPHPDAEAALAELAAIRAAAKHVSEGEGDEALRSCGEDYDAERSLFDAIAKDAP